jgi:hypothetical protein
VEYFKIKAGEQGYQVLINQALAEYILAKTVDLSVSEVNETIPDMTAITGKRLTLEEYLKYTIAPQL